jgi:hypothetical protein
MVTLYFGVLAQTSLSRVSFRRKRGTDAEGMQIVRRRHFIERKRAELLVRVFELLLVRS